MDITIKIPNGTMHIRAEAFFAEAGRGKVRRMLRLLQDTRPSQTQADELKSWLRGQIREEKDRQKQEALAYETQRGWLSELEEIYERMKNPCYAAFTRDRKKLEHARQKIMEHRRICRRHMQNIKTTQKREKSYKASLEDIMRILEGGRDEGD